MGLVLLGSAWPARGRAEDGAEIKGTAAVVVAKDPSGERAASLLQSALDAAVDARRSLRRVEWEVAFAESVEGPDTNSLNRAHDALQAGEAAYDALELDVAIARLSQAVRLYQEHPQGMRSVDGLTQALSLLASALTLQGSAEEGVATFVELLTIAPGYRLDRSPGTVRRMFDRALEQLRRAPTAALEVYSTPPYASVYLNGEFEGTTPLTVEELTKGTHHLRVEKVGHQPFGTTVQLSAEKPTTIQARLQDLAQGPELRDLMRRSRRQLPEGGMGPALRELARETRADRLIVAAASQSGQDITISASVFDVAAGRRLSTESRVFGADRPDLWSKAMSLATTLADTAAAGMRESDRSEGPPLPGPTPSSNPTATAAPGGTTPPEVYVGWAFTVLGGAAIIAGAAFGISALDASNQFQETPQLSPELDDIQERGRTHSTLADALLIGGAVSAVGGITLLLVSPKRRISPRDVLSTGPQIGLGPHGAHVGWEARF